MKTLWQVILAIHMKFLRECFFFVYNESLRRQTTHAQAQAYERCAYPKHNKYKDLTLFKIVDVLNPIKFYMINV